MIERYNHQVMSEVLQKFIEPNSQDGTLYEQEPPQDIFADFFIDLRHYCRVAGVDFDESVEQSVRLYIEEFRDSEVRSTRRGSVNE